MDAYSFEHTLAVILASDFGQINLLHKTVIYLCSESLTVYIAIQNFHSTSVKNSRISKGSKFWLVLKKTPALELNHMLQGYMLLVSLIFWVSKIPITSLHHPQLSLKEIFLHSSGSQAFPFLSLQVHPESFAINYIKFNFPPTVISHFFHKDFRLTNTYLFFHLLCPLIIFHTFPHYSLGRSGPISTLFIIIMSHCASRHIRPSCCLANTFRLVQPLWLLPCFSAPLYFTLSQLSFSK